MAQYTIDKFTYGGNTYKLKDKNALQLTGGTVTGPVIFGDSVTMDSFNAEAGVINGNLSVAGTIYGALSGTLNGLNTATGATANTIVARDGNGYIYGTYFNQSSGAETPTTNSYIIYANSDGWLRKSSLANIKSILGLGSNAYSSTAYLPLSGGTITGGLDVKGHIAGDGGSSGHGLYSGGGYHNAYNNIILHGDATTGSSGIAFISDKGDTTINQPSDRAFIQFHAYGVTTYTAEGTAPTLGTSGEANKLIIGVGNDADDMVVLQTPSATGLKHQVGTTQYTIYTTGNKPTASDVGLGNVENKSSATIRGELTSSNVTTALGYTPYNSTNPNGYTTNTGTITSVTTTAGAHTAISTSSGAVSFNVPTTAAHVGIKFGYTTSGNNRAVQQDSNGNLYVVQKDDDTNTWRGIQDNLTSSTNTTESLSAKQGYLLANGSARDSTKLPLSGGTLTGCLRINPTNDTNWSEGIRIYPASNGWTTLLFGGTDNTADTGTSANSWSLHSYNGNFYIARNGSDASSSAILKCESNVWSWNGTASGSISGNAATATMPLGFSSRVTDATWGNTTGTSFTSWNDSTGGSIDFRRDNPSSGKLSVKIDGRFYFNEGTTPAAGLKSANSYWGMTGPDGEDNIWIRTTSQGIIPYQGGGRGNGHNYIGTDSWYFSQGYIDNINSVSINASGKSYFGDTTTITDAVIGNLNATGYASFGETNLISYGTADLSSGSSPLATGHIYVVYE